MILDGNQPLLGNINLMKKSTQNQQLFTCWEFQLCDVLISEGKNYDFFNTFFTISVQLFFDNSFQFNEFNESENRNLKIVNMLDSRQSSMFI